MLTRRLGAIKDNGCMMEFFPARWHIENKSLKAFSDIFCDLAAHLIVTTDQIWTEGLVVLKWHKSIRRTALGRSLVNL